MNRLAVIFSVFLFLSCSVQTATQDRAMPKQKGWKVVFEDDFKDKKGFDTRYWSFCETNKVAWAKYLTPSSEYAFSDGKDLILRMNKGTSTYHSGGIQTKGKFSFTYGRVEVKAKFSKGKGSWPAIWMMPESPNAYGGWPKSGEIDVMEHVNNEKVFHQTIHNDAVTSKDGGSKATHAQEYNPEVYHIYKVEWAADKIDFYLDDTLTYTYRKPSNATYKEWPFDQPFYIILNQSGGAGWPGPINDADLPFEMKVDWVRVSQKKI